MCANDIVCQGAKPLFFLDYIAISKLIPEKVAEIVKGVADGCKQAGCVLLGGRNGGDAGILRPKRIRHRGFLLRHR